MAADQRPAADRRRPSCHQAPADAAAHQPGAAAGAAGPPARTLGSPRAAAAALGAAECGLGRARSLPQQPGARAGDHPAAAQCRWHLARHSSAARGRQWYRAQQPKRPAAGLGGPQPRAAARPAAGPAVPTRQPAPAATCRPLSPAGALGAVAARATPAGHAQPGEFLRAAALRRQPAAGGRQPASQQRFNGPRPGATRGPADAGLPGAGPAPAGGWPAAGRRRTAGRALPRTTSEQLAGAQRRTGKRRAAGQLRRLARVASLPAPARAARHPQPGAPAQPAQRPTALEQLGGAANQPLRKPPPALLPARWRHPLPGAHRTPRR